MLRTPSRRGKEAAACAGVAPPRPHRGDTSGCPRRREEPAARPIRHRSRRGGASLRRGSGAPERWRVRGLVREQPALHLETARVAAEPPARLDDAVARDEDRDPVLVVRAAHRARAPGPAEPGGDLAVAAGLAPWDGDELA